MQPKEGTTKGRWTKPQRASWENVDYALPQPRGKRLCRPGLPRAKRPSLGKRKPDEKGIASIDLKDLSGHQRLHVFAVDAWNVAYRPVSLPSAELKRKELRMVRELDPDKPFSEQKLFTSLAKGERFKLAGVTTSKVQAYDSLARAYGLLSSLSEDSNLAKFGFILDWPGLKPAEKQAKYSEFACHELNFFIHQKDPAFFKKVILPYLANKRDKTFMDHWLLGSDLSPYLEPYRFSRLNAVEKILMARKQKDGGSAMARSSGNSRK